MRSALNVTETFQRRLGSGAGAVSVTGVLGPDADEDGNPAGLVYFAVAREGVPTEISKRDFAEQQPDDVRRAAVLHALELLHQRAMRHAA
jgi:nicotinamide mononucleotide (NMN) deamidase PncC